ncbi:hypothetical protein TYRP_003237 [Tyrophagus putrescentiae]|nr:hypothetical protein TYRP_003237 [Tyrophagus putrescentiae]
MRRGRVDQPHQVQRTDEQLQEFALVHRFHQVVHKVDHGDEEEEEHLDDEEDVEAELGGFEVNHFWLRI